MDHQGSPGIWASNSLAYNSIGPPRNVPAPALSTIRFPRWGSDSYMSNLCPRILPYTLILPASRTFMSSDQPCSVTVHMPFLWHKCSSLPLPWISLAPRASELTWGQGPPCREPDSRPVLSPHCALICHSITHYCYLSPFLTVTSLRESLYLVFHLCIPELRKMPGTW